ncbi:hypothetical protein ACHZ98_27875 [Streptomyces sp. MAR4 CNY-716]
MPAAVHTDLSWILEAVDEQAPATPPSATSASPPSSATAPR